MGMKATKLLLYSELSEVPLESGGQVSPTRWKFWKNCIQQKIFFNLNFYSSAKIPILWDTYTFTSSVIAKLLFETTYKIKWH